MSDSEEPEHAQNNFGGEALVRLLPRVVFGGAGWTEMDEVDSIMDEMDGTRGRRGRRFLPGGSGKRFIEQNEFAARMSNGNPRKRLLSLSPRRNAGFSASFWGVSSPFSSFSSRGVRHVLNGILPPREGFIARDWFSQSGNGAEGRKCLYFHRSLIYGVLCVPPVSFRIFPVFCRF